ncbi:LacI family DNA-binding transcriptional regulator [Piscinibacter sp. XHJ-5]|uniref:LacI family DNA-binding transcriptional regulator n=1 Tax=Piscinibacter sp. XHJ-5 TaxID=3037797 RepID=UPI0024531B7E|nr:LacI family DNA-binding transcriptional regulator [Piscinibacter sp. XHJ-5]
MLRDSHPNKSITIHDVAKAADVSKSTVSLVLQGSPLIRDETAERVREAARKLGYVYNRRAAELRRQASNTVGVVINDLMNPFFAEVLVGIERRLVDAGYIVLMAHTHESLDRQRKVLASMREQNAAGLIICPAFDTPRTLTKEVQAWGIPLVVMVRSLGAGSYDYAGSDNERGVLLAMRHLLARGHKRIGFLGGRSGVVYEQRLRGYAGALEEAGIRLDERLIIASDPSRQGGSDAMAAMLRIKLKITAAVCYNDITAFGALATLGEHGLRAGTDFALIGFDNVLAAAHSNPPLTTVDIRPDDLGEHAAAALMARIENPQLKRQVYLAEPRLVLRQSG